HWLAAAGVDDQRADDVAWQLPRYFSSALSREWLAHRERYSVLKTENFQTPFMSSEKGEFGRNRSSGLVPGRRRLPPRRGGGADTAAGWPARSAVLGMPPTGHRSTRCGGRVWLGHRRASSASPPVPCDL